MEIGSITLLVYGLLMLGGGIGGYVSKHSVPSLISGVISGILLIAAFFVARSKPRVGYGIGIVVAVVLAAIFLKRIMDGHLMPALGLCLLSLCAAAILIGAWIHMAKTLP